MASQNWEAVVWLFPGEKNNTVDSSNLPGSFLQGSNSAPRRGNRNASGACLANRIPGRSSSLQLKKCWPVEDDEHLVEPEVVAAVHSACRNFSQAAAYAGGGRSFTFQKPLMTFSKY